MMFSTSNESFEQSDRRRVGKIVDTHREIDSSSNVSDRLSYTLNKTTSALTTELSLIIQCTPKNVYTLWMITSLDMSVWIRTSSVRTAKCEDSNDSTFVFLILH